MKTGFVQFGPALGDLQATMQMLDSLVPQCAGADLVVLPELCNSGYNFESKEQAWETSEPVGSSRFLQYLESLCQQHNFHIVSGFNEREGDHLYNSAVLVGPQGVMGTYRKLHLFFNEKDFFEPGNVGLPLFEVGGVRVGTLVCFDWLFPEAWRVLALKGVDLICHPSNLVLPGLAQKAIPIRALTNRIYIVTANRIGTEGDLTFTGLSTIADPRGEVLLQAPSSEEMVGIVDIDLALARDKNFTGRNNIVVDRRPDAYSDLVTTG